MRWSGTETSGQLVLVFRHFLNSETGCADDSVSSDHRINNRFFCGLSLRSNRLTSNSEILTVPNPVIGDCGESMLLPGRRSVGFVIGEPQPRFGEWHSDNQDHKPPIVVVRFGSVAAFSISCKYYHLGGRFRSKAEVH